MINPFSRTRFHHDLNLDTWYPEGALDSRMVAIMVGCIGFEERMLDAPFNRFADLTKITGIDLNFMELADFAAERRDATAGRPPVKTAFLATTAPTHALARMFGALMETSPVEVRVFRRIEDAAQWLGVPVKALRGE
jgi:hypothetical protein